MRRSVLSSRARLTIGHSRVSISPGQTTASTWRWVSQRRFSASLDVTRTTGTEGRREPRRASHLWALLSASQSTHTIVQSLAGAARSNRLQLPHAKTSSPTDSTLTSCARWLALADKTANTIASQLEFRMQNAGHSINIFVSTPPHEVLQPRER